MCCKVDTSLQYLHCNGQNGNHLMPKFHMQNNNNQQSAVNQHAIRGHLLAAQSISPCMTLATQQKRNFVRTSSQRIVTSETSSTR
ncbi:hypothetical protein FGO68_gene16003 [Halteria grandinella]|uniref:Uncharacterized protein n=1 Tax=Halteria grandinella TaxID=5974 RepID=A0A8J8P8V7_HALGN|nr:hypothetical protein FGO68_gene16003 [Halteria grandinella]